MKQAVWLFIKNLSTDYNQALNMFKSHQYYAGYIAECRAGVNKENRIKSTYFGPFSSYLNTPNTGDFEVM